MALTSGSELLPSRHTICPAKPLSVSNWRRYRCVRRDSVNTTALSAAPSATASAMPRCNAWMSAPPLWLTAIRSPRVTSSRRIWISSEMSAAVGWPVSVWPCAIAGVTSGHSSRSAPNASKSAPIAIIGGGASPAIRSRNRRKVAATANVDDARSLRSTKVIRARWPCGIQASRGRRRKSDTRS